MTEMVTKVRIFPRLGERLLARSSQSQSRSAALSRLLSRPFNLRAFYFPGWVVSAYTYAISSKYLPLAASPKTTLFVGHTTGI